MSQMRVVREYDVIFESDSTPAKPCTFCGRPVRLFDLDALSEWRVERIGDTMHRYQTDRVWCSPACRDATATQEQASTRGADVA